MNEELARRYYRLALAAAVRRNLTCAAEFARFACLLDDGCENAVRLLELCLHELEGLTAESVSIARQIRFLAVGKKWRKAARLAGSFTYRNVRVLNIQGCIYASAKQYGKAARFFAKALEKDCGNRLALTALIEATNRRKQIWGLL